MDVVVTYAHKFVEILMLLNMIGLEFVVFIGLLLTCRTNLAYYTFLLKWMTGTTDMTILL
jgi:hypothetical protein